MVLSNFAWIDEKKTVAGMGRPWRLYECLEALAERGIGAIVSLTLSPLDETLLREFGMDYLHVPVPDLAAPSLTQARQCVDFIQKCVRQGKKVVVHCGAGVGRTGAILACYLTASGQSPDEAIQAVRKVRPGSIETDEQERLVYEYACLVAKAKKPRRSKGKKRTRRRK